MHTSPVTEASPDVLVDRDAGLVAPFHMLCERIEKLEETTEHWLRREREKEWMHDGQVDSQLLGLPLQVQLRRSGTWPVRPLDPLWRAVNTAFDDSCIPPDLDAGDRQ